MFGGRDTVDAERRLLVMPAPPQSGNLFEENGMKQDITEEQYKRREDDFAHFMSYTGYWAKDEDTKKLLREAFFAAWEPAKD